MDIYISLFLLLLFLSFLKKNIFIYCVIYVLLFLLGALRNIEVGTDTANYYDIYNIINNDPDGLNYILGFVEPGWVFINRVCGILFDDYRSVIFIGLFLALTPLFIRVWKSSEKPFVVIFYYVTLYFYYNAFNITRQMIAVSIILFCINYLENNKKKHFIVGVFCAMLFHYSAIFCLSFIWIMKKVKVSIKMASILLCITYILGLYIIPMLIPAIPIVGHYSAYFMDTGSSGSVTRILLNIFFIFILASCNRKKVKSYLSLFFVGIVMYNLFAFSSAVGRLALYFTCTQLFLYPMITSKYRLNDYTIKLCSFVYATTYYFLMLNANSGEIVPYQIWE